MPGRAAAALRAGELTSDGQHRGRITWAAWLGEQYGRDAVQPARQPQMHGGTLNRMTLTRLMVAVGGIFYALAGLALLVAPVWFFYNISRL